MDVGLRSELVELGWPDEMPAQATQERVITHHAIAVWSRWSRRWHAAVVNKGASSRGPVSSAAYFAGLKNRSARSGQDLFVGGQGSMAVFEARRGWRRQVVGVKVLPFLSTTTLVALPLTRDTDREDVEQAHPVLAAVGKLGNYHWDTPAYRQACAAMSLPPDEKRPVFRARYKALADALMVEHGTRPFADKRYPAVAAVLVDLLELMREDRRPNPAVLDRVMRSWPDIASDGVPFSEEITALLGSDELLRIDKAPRQVGFGSERPRARIEFLPSRHGAGYSASISGCYGVCDFDGWVAPDYGSLHGLAVEPDQDELEQSSWLRVVRRRLPQQGVLFIPREQVQGYLDGEGCYWFAQHGGTSLHLWGDRVRTPTASELVCWSLFQPPLPMDWRLTLAQQRIRPSAPFV